MNNKNIKIEVLQTIDSTNNYLKQKALDGEGENYVVLALEQTAGKGTRGRSFSSVKGGVYLSILIKPDLENFNPALITTATAVAVTDSILELFKLDTKIKWVNDVYLNNKKVCGILCESVLDSFNNPQFVIVGIGVNLFKPINDFPSEIKDIATYISEGYSVELFEKFTASVINNFYKYLNSKNHLKLYCERSLILGKEILVSKNNETRTARALEIDNNCRLLVEFENGDKENLSSGDVTVRL